MQKNLSYPSHMVMEEIAMAYVPMQQAPVMYENLDAAFQKGTIFPALYKPFTGKRGKK